MRLFSLYFLIISVLSLLLPACSSLRSASTEAIRRAGTFLSEQPFRYDYVYLYARLQRGRPDLLPDLPQQGLLPAYRDSLDAQQRQPGERPPAAYLYRRLAEPEFGIKPDDLLGIEAESVDALLLPALYCDVFPPDTAQLFPHLLREAAAGDYRRSHTLLALSFLDEGHCLEPAALKKIRRQLVSENKKYLKTHNETWTDLYIETMALLQLNGWKMPAASARRLLAAQQADGGWGLQPDSQSHSHSTVLAL